MEDKPSNTRLYQNHHMDSTRWNWFEPRTDDIVIATSYKAGTTFTQTIVGNLLFSDGQLPGPAAAISPWLDMRIVPLESVLLLLEAQAHRRYIKTHLPLDGLPYDEDTKYICVSRDPRDVFMSLLNHWGSHTPEFYAIMNNLPGLVGDPMPEFVDDTKQTWRNWITRHTFEGEIGGYPYWSHLSHALTFWTYRHLPNIYMLHFNDLLLDLEGEMRKIAEFLHIDVPTEHWPSVVERCRFGTVKKDPSKVVGEDMNMIFKGGRDTFIHKGTNGRWIGVLDEEDLALYDEAMGKLPPDYAHWLAHGNAKTP